MIGHSADRARVDHSRAWWLRLVRRNFLDPVHRRTGYAVFGAESFVLKLLVEAADPQFRRLDWGIVGLFVIFAAVEAVAIVVWGMGAALVTVALSLFCSALFGCLAATRHLREMEESGVLEELRKLPLEPVEVASALLVAPWVAAALGLWITSGLGGVVFAAAVFLSEAHWARGIIAVLLFSFGWFLVRLGVGLSAVKYGVYAGWSAGVRAFAASEPMPRGIAPLLGPFAALEMVVAMLVLAVGLEVKKWGPAVPPSFGVAVTMFLFLMTTMFFPLIYWRWRAKAVDAATAKFMEGLLTPRRARRLARARRHAGKLGV